MDVSLTARAVRSQHLTISISLSSFALLYDLTTASFRAQVRPALGSVTLLYEWKSGGSSYWPNSVLSYEPVGHVLTLVAPSTDLTTAFNDQIMTASQLDFEWEVGFFLPSAPTDFIGVGLGSFPMQKGVVIA